MKQTKENLIEEIIEQTLKDTPLKAFFENETYQTVDIYEDTKERIHYALTQFAQAIKQRIEELPVYMKVCGGDLKKCEEAVLRVGVLASINFKKN